MSDSQSREIPLPMKREVRQRCGFGCVICGLPLYEYEHVLGFANVKRHEANEITLLCDQHHRERTSGLLPIEKVQQANADPFNLRSNVSKPYDLHFSGSACEVVVGGNSFVTQDEGYGTALFAVVVDNIPLLGFVLTDGHLLLNVNLFDEFNNLVLQIENNELSYSTTPWDIDLKGRRLQIREMERKILIDMTFRVPNKVMINRGRLLCNGVEILIRPDHILVTNNSVLIRKCKVENSPLGLIIGHTTAQASGFMSLQNIQRYQGDRTESVRWARDAIGKE